MDSRVSDLLDFGAALHAQHDHPDHPLVFAARLKIKLLEADEDSANPGPPAVITYNARRGVNRNRFSLWHEVAHVLMGWHGIDRDLDNWKGEGSGEQAREQAANLLAGLLMVPPTAVREATDLYGDTPAAILHMQERTGMSERVCLRRFTFADLDASRAAAVFIGPTVADVASVNYRLPFRRYDRIPEPALNVEHARLQLVRKSRVIAVWEG